LKHKKKYFYYYRSSGEDTPDIYIISIEDGTPQSVAFDTPFASLTLPATLTATLSDESTAELTITWDATSYTQDAAGEQSVFGDLTLPGGVTNPFLVRAVTLVTVQDEIFTETFALPTGFATYEILAGVTELNYAYAIGGGASGGSMGQVGRAPGSGGGAYARTNAIAVTEGQIVPYFIAQEKISDLPSGSNIEGFDGDISYFGPAAPAGSTILSGAGAPGGGTGADGNYYSDTSTGELYGPKAAGVWPGSPSAPWVRGAGGNAGTGDTPGTGGQGGQNANCIGDVINEGGDGIAAPASRSGAGGAAGGPSGAGANATTTGGTNSVGGVGVAPGGSGGNGSSGTPGVASDYGGGGAGARNTSITNTRGGSGKQGLIEIEFAGATVPPAEAGDVYLVAIWGQSNVLSPGNGAPGAPYEGALDTKIFINGTTGYEALEYGVNNNVGGSLTGLGPELSIAATIGPLATGETYIQKKGQSGTSMHTHWNVANNSTGRTAVTGLRAALSYLVAQGKTGQKIWVVFRQGEADMGASNPQVTSQAVIDAYRDVYYDLINYTVDGLETDGHDIGGAVELNWITCLVNNPVTVDDTWQTEIVTAQTEAMTDYATANPSYATKVTNLDTVSCAALSTMDGVHLGTSSEIQMGLDAAAFMVIP
jgi:hypothetical protein